MEIFVLGHVLCHLVSVHVIILHVHMYAHSFVHLIIFICLNKQLTCNEITHTYVCFVINLVHIRISKSTH